MCSETFQSVLFWSRKRSVFLCHSVPFQCSSLMCKSPRLFPDEFKKGRPSASCVMCPGLHREPCANTGTSSRVPIPTAREGHGDTRLRSLRKPCHVPGRCQGCFPRVLRAVTEVPFTSPAALCRCGSRFSVSLSAFEMQILFTSVGLSSSGPKAGFLLREKWAVRSPDALFSLSYSLLSPYC